MEKSTKKKIVALVLGPALLAGSALAEVIPQEMTLLYSYQEHTEPAHRRVDPKQETKRTCPLFADEDGNGIVSASVFGNSAGEVVCVKIRDDHYAAMGKRGGYKANPKASEYRSLFALSTRKADAAVVIDATSVAENVSASSLTFAHTASTTGSNVLLTVGAVAFGGTAASSVTYNSDPLALAVGTTTNAYVVNELWWMANPDTGANNIVVTYGATQNLKAGGISFVGANTVNNTQKAESLFPSSGTLSVTVTSDNDSMVVDAVAQQAGAGTLTVGADQTERWKRTGDRPGAGSTQAGAASVEMSWSIAGGDNENLVAGNVTMVIPVPYSPKAAIIYVE